MVELEEQWQEVKKPLEDFYQELLEVHKNVRFHRSNVTIPSKLNKSFDTLERWGETQMYS